MSKKMQIIPIEVLKVEDKLILSLSWSQIGLLGIPVLLGGILLLLPPAGQLVFYKIALIFLTTVVCGLLAFRFNDRLIIKWLLIIMKFNQRPKTYIKSINQASLNTKKSNANLSQNLLKTTVKNKS